MLDSTYNLARNFNPIVWVNCCAEEIVISINQLLASYRSGQSTASEVVQAYLDKIGQSDLNSFISVDREASLATSELCDTVMSAGGTLGPLHGAPVAIKDLIDVAGMRTTMGSSQYAKNVAGADAPVVQRLRNAGAVILGKTNTHQFAYGSTGDRSDFGPVRNPRNVEHVSGGSSSGSAAAVGAGLCLAALGTDTSASVRLPAAFCGVVGLKPTVGLLPSTGVFPLSPTLDHVGHLSATILDNALVLEVLCGSASGRYAAKVGKPIAGMKIGVPGGYFADFVSNDVQASVRRAREALEAAGARVVDIEVPETQAIYENQQLILRAEAYATHRAALDADKPYLPEVRTRLMTGADVSAADYLGALGQRHSAQLAFDAALADVDILLSPTCGVPAPRIDERDTLVDGTAHPTFWLITRLTAPTNLSGHPSLSVPFGETNGLPHGMQLIGRYQDEATLYQVGAVLESANRI